MKKFQGETLSWELTDAVVELALHKRPLNEIGSATLADLETFAAALNSFGSEARVLILYSALKEGFCAGADLRELYVRGQELNPAERVHGVRDFLERIHRVLNTIDA
ncbi:MAG TPA: hypothetical protein VE994_17935, partial [Terriglobales bacterium]|nr:hypothetical protein [Terriglobales bacterium]